MRVIIFIAIVSVAFIGHTAYFDYPYSASANQSPLKSIKQQYDKDATVFLKVVDNLVMVSESDNVDEQSLQNAILKARLAYKKIEFLIEYLDPESTLRYINGAPLPKVEPHVPELNVLKPSGLQTLDEMIFLEGKDAINEIVPLAKKLQTHVKRQVEFQRSTTLEHRYIIEGIRYGVLRVFTLGLTGFDTPGSVNAIPEAISSMESMQNALSQYTGMKNQTAAEQAMKLSGLMESSIAYLQANNDFDSFDRLYFYRSFVRPLFSGLLTFHQSAHIELKKEIDRSNTPHNYMEPEIFDENFFNLSYYTQIASSDLENPEIIDLGKKLFYDPALSKDFSLSCASCHEPSKAFTDGLAKSKTNQPGHTTRRNSPTLVNSAIYGRYFWDMREYDLERQIKHVAADTLEFNHDLLDMADRLAKDEDYAATFSRVYGDRDKYGVSSWSISNALAAYVATLTSFDSPFDQYARGESDEFSKEAYDGFNLFMGKAACGTCHFAPAFNGTVPPFYKDSESEVLGVTMGLDSIHPVLDNDPGRIANGRMEESADFYLRSMKTATVRNAALTGPYMHNGSFNTLEEVVRFYNLGGGAGMGLDVPYQTLPDSPLGLSDYEITAIVKFMETLTDTTGMIPRF